MISVSMRVSVVVGCAIVSSQGAAAQDCGPVWSPLGSGLDDIPFALGVFDDGSGPALYAGGNFLEAGGEDVNRIARWDGEVWSALSDGILNGSVTAFAVFDDGTGPALYVGGLFNTAGGLPAEKIAKWDGSSWSEVGGGLDGGVNALVVFDDGSGPALYVGGRFSLAGSNPANRIARWDGTSWSALGAGVEGCVPSGGCTTSINDLVVFDDGSGPALYAAGWFEFAGGEPAKNIAKWDGQFWSSVGEGAGSACSALVVHDDGSGPALYAEGSFETADGISVSNGVGKWDGEAWVALDAGLNGPIYDMTVFDDGLGPAIYICGFFTLEVTDFETVNRIAKWSGDRWTPIGSGTNAQIEAIQAFDGGLYAGGMFTEAGGVAAERIAVYRNSLGTWSGLGMGADDAVRMFQQADLGNGEELFVGGEFSSIFGQTIQGIVSYDGVTVSELGSGIGGSGSSVLAATMHDDGSGPALYVGGVFTEANGGPGNFVARWDGTQWSALGEGTNGTVLALASVDHGDGPVLYAGGQFTLAGGQTANRIARWNGSDWETVDGGVNSNVRAMVGIGPNLIVGGDFTNAGGNGIVGGVEANHIARFDGNAWSTLGLGTNAPVHALLQKTDDEGTTLFVAGAFSVAGGVSTNRVARWNNQSWSALGDGFDNGIVLGLTLLDLGTDFETDTPLTPVALGSFTMSDGRTVNHIARWNGRQWREFRQGATDRVGVGPGAIALAATDYGSLNRMIVGGEFTDAGGADANRIARWTICPELATPCPADVSGDGTVNLADLNIVLANFGQTTSDGDTNDDAVVDLGDLNAVLAAFGTPCD